MGRSWAIEAMPLKGILGHTHVCAYTCTCVHMYTYTCTNMHLYTHISWLPSSMYFAPQPVKSLRNTNRKLQSLEPKQTFPLTLSPVLCHSGRKLLDKMSDPYKSLPSPSMLSAVISTED